MIPIKNFTLQKEMGTVVLFEVYIAWLAIELGITYLVNEGQWLETLS